MEIKETNTNNYTEENILDFYKKYSTNSLTKLDMTEKIKMCSSDDFNTVASNFIEKCDTGEDTPVMISNVGGFYVTATLAGIAASKSNEGEHPTLLFFDKKNNNIQNALFNTMLMQICDTKEKYITNLFGLTKTEIVKVLNPKLYNSFIEQELVTQVPDDVKTKTDKKEYIKNLYELKTSEIDSKIENDLLTDEIVNNVLESKFNLQKLAKYSVSREYDDDKHYDMLVKLAKGKFNGEYDYLFRNLASNMTEYYGLNDNYQDLVKYLSADIKLNKTHILSNNQYYEAYKNLIKKDGTGYVKFVDSIDLNKEEDINKLEEMLRNEQVIHETANKNKFPIDVAFIPHVMNLKKTYPFIKKNVEDYIMLNPSVGGKRTFTENSTATLNIKDYKSIGAQFIKDERDARKPLNNLAKIEVQDGFPLITFMAGADFGNIYHNEVYTKNVIDMAIHDHVDTVYIQGLIYSTYYHEQTSRRQLSDPGYDTLDSRLKAAHEIIKQLNDNGIKVVYQMGDEERHLFNDMFKIYTREQGVIGNNFLARDDLRTEYDWVKPIIIQQLIPYLIRSGEDVTNFSTDECKKTRVSMICHALKAYNEGLPMGNSGKFIDPKYLEDTEMFRVVNSTVDKYDKDDALSVNLMSNPNFSHITQYGKPNAGVIKNLRLYQTKALDKYKLQDIPQLNVDSRQGMMSISYQGDQATVNVPQMIDDSYYLEHQELLSGIKEHILEDPTHKRVSQMQTKPNFPGSWTVAGDAREIMTVVPYYKRVKEVMEYVQKTGEGLPEVDVLHLNDTQVGSPTERLEYMVKMLDYAFYHYNIKGIWGNGDFQQGWNYPKFANESRHLGSMSVSQQMVDFVRLQRPWIKNALGVVRNDLFVGEYDNFKIDYNTCNYIIKHLVSNHIIKIQNGIMGIVYAIDKNIDYKTVDLKLPLDMKPYESIIREKLCGIKNLWFYHLVEGNHEYNTDWNNKGYRLIEHINQELTNYKTATGNTDLEVADTEYFVNSQGDIVNAPYGFKTINGYNIAYGHSFRAPGKGNGGSPTMAMSNYFDQMGEDSNRIDRAFMGHLHIFETSVINNKLLSVTGCSAGQSGYEQNLGYSSHPLFVIDRYLSDGRICVDTIGSAFLDTYEIQNPEVKAKGLENFIQECLTEEATIYGPEKPKQIQKIYQRKLVAGDANKRIGPKIN